MSAWILRICVDETKPYWYEVDKAFEKLGTIPQGQNIHIKKIAVGDIVYIYENTPVKSIGWKCKVVAVNIAPQDVDIDDSEFAHGYDEGDDSYIKITAIGKYDDEARKKLSLDKLRENGLTQERSSFNLNSPRVNPKLLDYINSVEPSVVYND